MFLYCLFAIIAEDVKLIAKTIVKEENMRDNVQFNNPVQNVNLRWWQSFLQNVRQVYTLQSDIEFMLKINTMEPQFFAKGGICLLPVMQSWH